MASERQRRSGRRRRRTIDPRRAVAWRRSPATNGSGFAGTTRARPDRLQPVPFLSTFLTVSGRAPAAPSARTGWQGITCGWKTADGSLLGAVPCYVKSHSQGEYVFDHGWADAFERAGGRYYPKLQAAVPFTPATGPRLLVARGARP